MRLFIFTVTFALTMSVNNAFALTFEAKKLQSKSSQVSLVELYTSEGCSSCPPAEHWLNELKAKNNLWEDFVPVAFHVDYWDYLGWKDAYAKSDYSERQRLYALENREPTVYTPGVRAEGQEWRHWRRADLGKLAGVERQNVGVLNLDLAADGSFTANFNFSEGQSLQGLGIRGKPYFLTVAILGMGISTDVKRGENTGRTLDHEFIVLEAKDYKIQGSEAQSNSWQGKIPDTKVAAGSYAIAAWVTSDKSLTPIQAVGGFLN